MYEVARRRISILESFLSSGSVGMSLRNLSKPAFTFSVLTRSRLLAWPLFGLLWFGDRVAVSRSSQAVVTSMDQLLKASARCSMIPW